MKKLLAMVLALTFVFFLGGCNDKNNENETDDPDIGEGGVVTVEDSLILVQSGATQSKPYENFLWAEEWSEDGWISADGTSITDKFSEKQHEIPQITYGEDFEIHYKEGVKLISLSVYNSDFEILQRDAAPSALKDLTNGMYYLIITVKDQGKYIEAEQEYEYAGYECVYQIVK